MRDWEFKEWLIVIGVVLAAAFLFFLIIKSAAATPAVDVIGCRQTNYPAVCAASYHRCNTIGLDKECLAVSQLDGELGHSFTRNANEPTSQNIKTGDKPVETVHK